MIKNTRKGNGDRILVEEIKECAHISRIGKIRNGWTC